jgi:hypothetical protein
MTTLKQIEAAVDALEDARHYLSEAVLTGVNADGRDAYIHSLFMRRTAMLTLVAGLCKDAGRYRYLRECYPNDSPMTVVANPKMLLAGTLCHTAERLDAAIDAALAATDEAQK